MSRARFPAARALASCGAAAALLLAALPAHALFSDDEARQAIVDLRQLVAAQDRATQQRLDEVVRIQAQQTEQLEVLRRSLLDLNSAIEALRGDLAKLRGADEQLTRELAELQKRQRDISQAVDDRLRRFEPVKVTVDGREFVAEPEEKRTFEDALGAMRTGEFERAVALFQILQRRWPNGGYVPASQFWAGNAYYGRKDYKEAVASFRAYLAGVPDSPRAPEAMLGLANSQAEMKDTRGARATLEELVKAHPNSDAAAAAQQRLKTLR